MCMYGVLTSSRVKRNLTLAALSSQPDDMDKLKATSSGSSGAGKAGADNPNTLVFIGGLLVVLVALYLKFWNVAEEQE